MLKNFEIILTQIKDEIYNMGQKVVIANETSLNAITTADTKLFVNAKSELNNLAHTSNKIDNLILYVDEYEKLKEKYSTKQIEDILNVIENRTDNHKRYKHTKFYKELF